MKQILLASLCLFAASLFADDLAGPKFDSGNPNQVARSGTGAIAAAVYIAPTPAGASSGTGSVILSGTAETPTFPRYTTGTTAFAAGATNLQFIPSTSATGSIIMSSGTYFIPGAGNLGVVVIPTGRPGNTLISGTVVLVSGTVDSIQNR